jgi:hypothetical protein
MADKSFALKVELQGDVEKFKKNMEKAKSYSAGFAKGVERASQRANKANKGMTGGFNKLTGAMAAAGGGAGAGLLSQALSSLSSPAGLATTAIAGVAMAIRQARADMEKFELTTDALNVGLSAFMESGRKMRKEEKQALRGGRLSSRREILRVQRELVSLRSELKSAEASGDTVRATALRKDIEAAKILVQEKDKLERDFAQKRKDLGYLGFGKRDAQEEFAKANLDLQKANRDAIVAKREQKAIEREIMQLSQKMAVNSGLTNEERLEAIRRTEELRGRLLVIADIQNVQIEAQKNLNSLGMNTLQDEDKVTALMTEREKLLKKMVTSGKDIDNTRARIAKSEQAITDELAEQASIKNDALLASKLVGVGGAGQARGATQTGISYAGAGVDMGSYSEGITRFKEDMIQMTDELNMIIGDFLAGSIADLASGIGEALGSGDFDGLAKSVLRSFGGFFKQIGGMFIAYGIANTAFIKALQNPLNPASPAVLIGAGAALVAIGGAISGATSSFAGSGSTGSGQTAGGYSSGQQQQHVTFELEGDKLKGAINNSDRKSNNFQ